MQFYVPVRYLQWTGKYIEKQKDQKMQVNLIKRFIP